ncbi:hypothetical protein B0H13DRAFT_1924093 [Mycena leptocephala]|nr:hypothetical protein B0H13DRAFT_1924093 [Mycena leptocephala]
MVASSGNGHAHGGACCLENGNASVTVLGALLPITRLSFPWIIATNAVTAEDSTAKSKGEVQREGPGQNSDEGSHTCGDGAEEDGLMRGDEEEDIKTDTMETLPDAKSFCNMLRANFKAGEAVDFHMTPRQRIQMVTAEIWKLAATGGHDVKDHKKLASGQWTRFWCSQGEARKKKSKASQNLDVHNWDNVSMKRYPCGSKLTISCRMQMNNDKTYNTNSKHLELYSIMAEQDRAGFPLSYLLLSTVTSIDQGKWMKALMAWAKYVCDKYRVKPQFSHIDKDMTEISVIKSMVDEIDTV